MIFEIEINNKPVKVKKGETILSVLNRTGIKVPTLCSMKDFSPTGMCRMCVVEVEGRDNLIPSCSFKVEEWMKIKTHSPKVVKARKTIVELLLANHPDDCLYCERNGNCELQKHAEDLHVRERRIGGQKLSFNIDKSSVAIVHEHSKCILCGRCIRVCDETIGVSALDFTDRGIYTSVQTALNKPINYSNCINCGQCTMVCPTAALTERINFSELQAFLHDPNKIIVALYSPSIAITLADEFGIRAGKDINGIINAILRKIGFDKVFDTSFGSDLMVMETASEIKHRIQNNIALPVLSSCCPGWVKYVEQYFHDLIPNLASSKSSQQMMGAMLKTYYAQKHNILPENIYTVSIMPCTARKFEAIRPDMTYRGISDVDSVITTRELLRMIRMYGIDVANIEPETVDMFFSNPSSAGKMVNVSGGTAEMVSRTLHWMMNGNEIQESKLSSLRGSKPLKEVKFEMDKTERAVMVVNGMSNAKKLLEEIANGRNDLAYVEVMACPNGCIAGGGQPINSKEEALKQRTKIIYDSDEKDTIRAAHNNKQVQEFYDLYFGTPHDKQNFNLLSAAYSPRNVLG